jgi:hypothetical protein
MAYRRSRQADVDILYVCLPLVSENAVVTESAIRNCLHDVQIVYLSRTATGATWDRVQQFGVAVVLRVLADRLTRHPFCIGQRPGLARRRSASVSSSASRPPGSAREPRWVH